MLTAIGKWLSRWAGLVVFINTTVILCAISYGAEQNKIQKQLHEQEATERNKKYCSPFFFVRVERAAYGLGRIVCIDENGNDKSMYYKIGSE